jgi:hypothetical protein
MPDEELRTRLQALAAAGRQEPQASTLRAIRRRSRRKVRNALVLTVIGVLVVAGGVWLLPEQRQNAVVPVAPGGAPATFLGQAQQDRIVRLAVIDTNTGQLRRWLPGATITGSIYAISPDLRKLYLYQRGKEWCKTWTEVDLTTGARGPAFAGRRVGLDPTPSPDGRSVAFLGCRPGSGLAVLHVVSGRQQAWTIPERVVLGDWPLQWSPDATRLGFLMRRSGQAQQIFHVLPVAGTTSITQGHDLPLSHRPGCELVLPPHFRDNRRVLVVEQCPNDSFLVDYDLRTGRKVARVALGLQAKVFDVVVDRSGQHVLLLAGQQGVKQPPSIYVVRDGRAQPVPNRCDCWKVAW